MENPLEKAITAQIETEGYKAKITVCYSQPRTNKKDFIDAVDRFLEAKTSISIHHIVTGDFNINIIDDNGLTKMYHNVINSNGFQISDPEPTRETDTSSTCLDHVIYQNIPSPYIQVLKYQQITDHYPILIEWNIESHANDVSHMYRDTRFVRNPQKVLEYQSKLQSSLEEIREDILNERDINKDFKMFNVSCVTNEFAPICTKPEKPSGNPKWFTNR